MKDTMYSEIGKNIARETMSHIEFEGYGMDFDASVIIDEESYVGIGSKVAVNDTDGVMIRAEISHKYTGVEVMLRGEIGKSKTVHIEGEALKAFCEAVLGIMNNKKGE